MVQNPEKNSPMKSQQQRTTTGTFHLPLIGDAHIIGPCHRTGFLR